MVPIELEGSRTDSREARGKVYCQTGIKSTGNYRKWHQSGAFCYRPKDNPSRRKKIDPRGRVCGSRTEQAQVYVAALPQ